MAVAGRVQRPKKARTTKAHSTPPVKASKVALAPKAGTLKAKKQLKKAKSSPSKTPVPSGEKRTQNEAAVSPKALSRKAKKAAKTAQLGKDVPKNAKNLPVKRSASQAGLASQAKPPKKKGKGKKSKKGSARTVAFKVKHFQDLSSLENSDAKRRAVIYNLPDMNDKKLKEDLLRLFNLKERDMVSCDVKRHAGSRGTVCFVVFQTEGAALVSKKFNGELLGNKHIFVYLGTDYSCHVSNCVAVHNLPKDYADEDVFNCFKKFGKIFAMLRKPKENVWLVTFDTTAAKRKALSSAVEVKGVKVEVSDHVPSSSRTLVLSKLPAGVENEDIQNFVKGVGTVDKAEISSSGEAARVVFKSVSDVQKLISLRTKKMKQNVVQLLVDKTLFNECLLVEDTINEGKNDVKVKAEVNSISEDGSDDDNAEEEEDSESLGEEEEDSDNLGEEEEDSDDLGEEEDEDEEDDDDSDE